MSLVEAHTEIAVMAEAEAREITNDIRRTGTVMWSQIIKAFQGRAWISLGYPSWDDYCDAEFDGARIKLPREERTTVVASLADAGMSVPAIASATGVTERTVQRDRASQGATFVTPCPDDDIIDAEVIDSPTPEPRKVTGTDGKSYTLTPKPVATPDPEREAERQRRRLATLRDRSPELAAEVDAGDISIDEASAIESELLSSAEAAERARYEALVANCTTFYKFVAQFTGLNIGDDYPAAYVETFLPVPSADEIDGAIETLTNIAKQWRNRS